MKKEVLFLAESELYYLAKDKGIRLDIDGDKGNLSVEIINNDSEYCTKYFDEDGDLKDQNELLSDILDVEVESAMCSDGDQKFPNGWIMVILK